MGKFYKKLFAKYYDPFMVELELRLYKRRDVLLSPLSGVILEVGSGTGVNFPFYNARKTKVVAIEPSLPMLEKAKLKTNYKHIDLHNIGVGYKELELLIPENGFDAIVCTLVLCTVPNLEETLEDFKRFLAPNGQLIVMEHIHAKKKSKAVLQNIVNPIWRKIGDGCNLNRKTDEVLKSKGFKAINNSYFYSASLGFYEGVFTL